MYSKDEAARLKQEFWTTFGQYMALENSSEGMRINWINYKTGIKYLYFKMEADNKKLRIGIEISHPDPGIQELIFEQFKEFKNILNGYLEEEWVWELHTGDEYGNCSPGSPEWNMIKVFLKEKIGLQLLVSLSQD